MKRIRILDILPAIILSSMSHNDYLRFKDIYKEIDVLLDEKILSDPDTAKIQLLRVAQEWRPCLLKACIDAGVFEYRHLASVYSLWLNQKQLTMMLHDALRYLTNPKTIDLVRCLISAGVNVNGTFMQGFRNLRAVEYLCNQPICSSEEGTVICLLELLIAAGSDVTAASGVYDPSPLQLVINTAASDVYVPSPLQLILGNRESYRQRLAVFLLFFGASFTPKDPESDMLGEYHRIIQTRFRRATREHQQIRQALQCAIDMRFGSRAYTYFAHLVSDVLPAIFSYYCGWTVSRAYIHQLSVPFMQCPEDLGLSSAGPTSTVRTAHLMEN